MAAPGKSSLRRWWTAASGSCRSRRSTSAPRFRSPQANFCAWRATSAADSSCDSPMRNPQLNGDGRLQHLLTIEGLPREVLVHILDTAASFSGVAHLIASHVASHVHVINAGDGRHAHPTQGLLDIYTIRHYKKDFTQLSVAIVGDVLHSRVARSLIHA